VGLRVLLVVCGAILILVETEAHAYADPGSGTMLVQMAFAAFFGLMFYARRIFSWVRKLVGREPGPAVTAAASKTGEPSSGSTPGR
jgi:hypothetical protein